MPLWLDRLNYYRSLANLPAVSEGPNLSAGDNDAAKYMVLNNTITHQEVSGNPGYTDAGATAAADSDIAVYYSQLPPQTQMVDEWMTGAFHGPNMLDPRLQTVGFGTYQDLTAPGYKSATALNVESGINQSVTGFPVYWPGNGQTVPLTSYSMYGTEWPDARTNCVGYTNPGLPISLQLGAGNVASTSNPVVSGYNPSQSSFMLNGNSVPFCEIDEFNYTNTTQTGAQSWGQQVLHGQGTIVLLPQQPLVAGTYRASITVNGQTYTWSFTVLPPVTYTMSGLPAPLVSGQRVNGQVIASGGSGGPYTFSSTTLPEGLSLSSDGLISGVVRGAPSTSWVVWFALTVTDNAGHTSSPNEFGWKVVQAPITVTPGNPLPNATQGQPYSVQLSATGGVAPYTFSASAADLTPVRLSLTSQGLISGTPPLMSGTLTGLYNGFVSDSNGSQVPYSFQITFVPPSQKRSPQPAFADGSLVKAADQPEVYAVYGGAKFWIPSPAVFNAMGFQWKAIQTVSDQDIAAIPNVPQVGTLLKEQSTPPVYVMQGGAKCHVLSSAGVVAAGGWDKVRVVPDGALANIPDGNDIP